MDLKEAIHWPARTYLEMLEAWQLHIELQTPEDEQEGDEDAPDPSEQNVHPFLGSIGAHQNPNLRQQYGMDS